MKPRKIATDQQKLEKTIAIYQLIASKLTRALHKVSAVAPKMTAYTFLKFCSQHTATISMGRGGERLMAGIQQLYVVGQAHNYIGQDLNRLVELKIVKLPELVTTSEAVHEALTAILQLKNYGTTAREGLFFYYPLIDMFDGRGFYVPDDLKAKAEVFFSRYIVDELQKEVFESFGVIASQVNKLIEKGLISPHNFHEDIFRSLGEAFKKDREQIVVSGNAFWFFDKLGSGRIAPKVTFDEMFAVEPEMAGA